MKMLPADSEVVRQGKERPRPLTHDETTLAARNRRTAADDLYAMIAWEERGFVSGPPDDLRESTSQAGMPVDLGNYSQFFLNAEPRDERDWTPAYKVLRRMERDEARSWTHEVLSIEDLVKGNSSRAGCRKHQLEQAPGERGEGIVGLHDDYYDARRAMTRLT